MSYINYLRTGERPFPFSETVEMIKIISAGILSRNEGGKKIVLDDLKVSEVKE